MKNFFDTNDEKITEKAFSQSLIISVISILLCIVALCSITYAWFSSETSSGNNTLISGSFDIDVSIVNANNEKVEIDDDGKFLLKDVGKYTIELSPSAEATVKGYCIVMIDGKPYKTDVILDENMTDDTYTEATAPFTFTIETKKENTVVSFESHWGVLVEPDIEQDSDPIVIEAAQVEEEKNATE